MAVLGGVASAAAWDNIGEVVNTSQLMGLDAMKPIGLIVPVASLTGMPKKTCRGTLLEQLKTSEPEKNQETWEPSEQLRNALRRTSMLVYNGHDSSYLYSLAMGPDLVHQFRKGQVVTQQPEQIENNAAVLKKENEKFRLKWQLSQANLELRDDALMPSHSAETETKIEYPLGSMEVYEPSGYSTLEAKEIYPEAKFFERRGNDIHEFLESESGEPGMVFSSDDDTEGSTGCYGRFCALHCGAKYKHSKAMRLCMSMGSAVSLPASKGTTPLLLRTEAISRGRVGNNFWCTNPSDDLNGTFWLQGCHVVHGAYNSLWMGNFLYPDRDIFQSTHPCVVFHAATRTISDGPSYFTNSVGNPNFQLLKSWVLSCGSILHCELHALLTRDRLFEDPLQAKKTMLKLWNLNKFTGGLGAFNCQGGGSS